MENYNKLLETKFENYINKKKKEPVYYVIQEGDNKGIYYSWNEIKDKIKFSDNFKKVAKQKNTNNNQNDIIYRKFTKKKDAISFLNYNYTIEDLTINEEQKALLSYNNKDIYINYLKTNSKTNNNISPFNINKLNKYIDGNFYIFVSGKSITKSKNVIKSKYGIYFGMKSINISDYEDTKTDIQYILAIEFIINLLDKNKKQIKEYQLQHTNNIIYIVLDNIYNYNIFKYLIYKWSKSNWKTHKEINIKNINIIKMIYIILSKLKLHKIKYEFIFINKYQLPPSDSKELYLWKNNLISNFLANI